MLRDSNDETASWTRRAYALLAELTAAELPLRAALRSGEWTDSSRQAVEALSKQVEGGLFWLETAEDPKPQAEVELRAGLGVFRNVAFAGRRLCDLSPGESGGRLTVSCESLLAQADQHLRAVERLISDAPS